MSFILKDIIFVPAHFVTRVFKKVIKGLGYTFAIILILIVRIIRPIVLIRWGSLWSFRIGHFAANTEIYLCEKDASINKPQKYILDLFYLVEPISNHQLEVMWKRVLRVLPSWFLMRIYLLNQRIPGGKIHEIGTNTNMDRDVHNLLDKYPAHLKFTDAEERKGREYLIVMGLPPGAKFICLMVRDNAYLNTHQPEHDWSGHHYRDCNIQNYRLVAETLADRGYYVFRMGAIVREPLKSTHPKIIDYAMNGMRNDFMDIYLGAKCKFCITTGTGWETIPAWLFRKPMIFTNLVPLGYVPTFSVNFSFITKKYFDVSEDRYLTFSEIFARDLGFCLESSQYEAMEIKFKENSPEEILDAVMEVEGRLTGTWKPDRDDEELQDQFWKIFPENAISPYNGAPLHGEIRSQISAAFLRKNKTWLQ